MAISALPMTAQAQAQAQEGVNVGKNSAFAKLVPAETVERSAVQNYQQMLQQAAAKNALAPADNAQLKRLRGIAQRLIPFAIPWNERAKQWQWEVNLIGSTQINAFCMPGGKIAFYSGILKTLQLTDDEVAMVSFASTATVDVPMGQPFKQAISAAVTNLNWCGGTFVCPSSDAFFCWSDAVGGGFIGLSLQFDCHSSSIQDVDWLTF